MTLIVIAIVGRVWSFVWRRAVPDGRPTLSASIGAFIKWASASRGIGHRHNQARLRPRAASKALHCPGADLPAGGRRPDHRPPDTAPTADPTRIDPAPSA